MNDPKYSKRKLAAVYRLLEPDCIDIQVDGHLIKLDKRSMEFQMLNLMMAMFYIRMGEKIVQWYGAFQSSDFSDVVEHFPDHILPARRKKRAYISSILSKNEVSREGKYNRKLFLRMKHGQYIVNPCLCLRVEGEWVRIYELLSFDMISVPRIESVSSYEIDELLQKNIRDYSERIDHYAETGSWENYF